MVLMHGCDLHKFDVCGRFEEIFAPKHPQPTLQIIIHTQYILVYMYIPTWRRLRCGLVKIYCVLCNVQPFLIYWFKLVNTYLKLILLAR